MKALIQRVAKSIVQEKNQTIGSIGKGLVIFLGVKKGDGKKQAEMLAEKTVNLRIMSDQNGKMNLSLKDAGAEILVVSQFTLCADTRRGRRPSFMDATEPDLAEELYLYYIQCLGKQGVGKIAAGRFGAYMKVEIINDGPVTIMLDAEEE